MQILDDMINTQKVKNDAAFCKEVGYAAQSLSNIRAGTRNVPIELISNLFSKYRGNPIFIFAGEGELYYRSEQTASVEESRQPYGTRNSRKFDSQHYESLLAELLASNSRMEKLVESYAQQAKLNVEYTDLLKKRNTELEVRIKELEHGTKSK